MISSVVFSYPPPLLIIVFCFIFSDDGMKSVRKAVQTFLEENAHPKGCFVDEGVCEGQFAIRRVCK
jgi:hypothetical protein